jgi:lipoprotein-anchoring transpeptidase ErfK/SrfK
MAQRKRLPRSKRERGSGKLAGLFVLLCVVGAGVWLWWKSQTVSPRKSQSQPALPTARLPATNLPPVLMQPATNPPPRTVEALIPVATSFPRPPENALEAQVALARRLISSGSIDGVTGAQTRAALRAFQRRSGLPETLELDATTRGALRLDAPPLTNYVITANDLARLQPLSKTWVGKSEQTALDYETILELVAERGHASPNLIRRLNPGVNWTNVTVGTEIQIPAVEYTKPANKAAFVVISLGEKRLQAFDSNTNLLTHFPCSIAARVEKRPAGELRVTAIAEDPNYTFNPEVFPESAEARELNRKIILPPGPNNPVGTAWISLDLPGYGIHGTPSPEQVGRTESHGCFRLANWNASYLVKLVWVGMPVYVEP